MVVASRSKALAVMPTVVPMATFSSTLLLVLSVSVGAVTSNSSRSLMAMVKVCVAVEPSLEVACTVIERVAPTISRLIAAAAVTTPVFVSMANRPSGLLVRL